VLLTGAVSNWTDAGEKRVGAKVAQLDRGVTGALEVEVEAGDVVEARRERLTVAQWVDIGIRGGLLLIGDAIRTSSGEWCRCWR
jgi:hypothetical protein